MEVCYILFGVLLGTLLTVMAQRKSAAGVLHVDYSDPDGPYIFLELKKNLPAIRSHKTIVLRVDESIRLPQK